MEMNLAWLRQAAATDRASREPAAPSRADLQTDAQLADTAPHIVFSGVGKTYSGRAGQTHALRDISFGIERGRIFGIIGRSGAGKSTLLRAINMLEQPSTGHVTVDGIDVGQLDENGLVTLRRKIGMIFQHFNLMSAKTVRDNVALPLRVTRRPTHDIRQRVDALLELVGLSGKADAYPAMLSGGQKQRVGIARALVHDPEILLCDEATSALDPETTQSILALLRDINQSLGLTIVLITHDMSVIRDICDEVLVLDGGEIVEQGEVWRVFGNPQADATRALLRPLRRELPDDLARILQPTPPAQGRAVLSVHFSGSAHPDGISLQNLLAIAPDTRLLHSSLERIQGHAQGDVLLSIPVSHLAALHHAPFPPDTLKILGYVHEHA
ncbi:MAG: ATP-binding cassette domain-containing protein [Corticimicrobacter sp.]|uniref:methionine ABC transporter ATP-binding protein n=1 Tax=Corticimicrobacter sp. TaxID=2678536 RepID=UPI0032DB618D